MVLKFSWIKILFIKLIIVLNILYCLQKPVLRCIYCTSLCLQNRFLFSSNEHAQSSTLGTKLMFSVVSRHFVDAPDSLRKLESACVWLNVSEQYSRHTTWKISMHSLRSKTHILGIFTQFRCSKTSVWFRTTYFMSKTRVSGGFMPFLCRT